MLVFLVAAFFSAAGPTVNATEPMDSDADGRNAVMSSPAWHESLHGFDEWLSAQTIYNADEVAQIKNDLQRRLEIMNTEELQDFQRDLDAKLSILSSAEWQDTIDWLSSTLAAATPSYAKKLDLRYPDVARLTAAQLQRAFFRLQRRRWSEHQESLAFERMRETRLSMHQRQLRANEEARERALDRAAMSDRFSEYHPSHHPIQQRRRRPFYPPYAPFGFGFGFGGFGLF